MTRHAVLASLETDDHSQCVDFFLREDGTFGFEQYRRDYLIYVPKTYNYDYLTVHAPMGSALMLDG